MMLLWLALRNLQRNRRRTLITALAVGFGTLSIVLLQALVNGFIQGVVEAVVSSKTGAVQVFREGFLGADDPLKNLLDQDPALEARLLSVPGVVAIAPRIDFDGMVSNGAQGTMFAATAIDPEREYAVCPKRATYVGTGSKPLMAGERTHALIGSTLASSLGAGKGTTLVLQAATAHAGTNALDVTVSGFLPSFHPSESKRLCTVDLGFAQDLLRAKGKVTSYVIRVADIWTAERVAARVRAVVGPGHEVTTWKELSPDMYDRTKLLRAIFVFVAVILSLLVVTGIANTMGMSVYERIREIGTMLALGITRRKVTLVFMGEAAILGVVSSSIGSVFGWILVRVFAQKGFGADVPGGEAFVIYPSVDASFLGWVFVLALLGTTLAALVPVGRASRLTPATALRS